MKKFWIDVFNVELGRQIVAGMYNGVDAKAAVESIGLCLPTHWHATLIYVNADKTQAKGFVKDLNGFQFILHITCKGTGDGT